METILLLLLASTVAGQFAMEQGMRADVAFGDDNDRFDVTGMMPFDVVRYNMEDGEEPERRASRRSFPRSSRRFFRRSGASIPAEWRPQRRFDSRYEEDLFGQQQGAEDYDLAMLPRAQDYGASRLRRRVLEDIIAKKEEELKKVKDASKNERELNLIYPFPLRLKVRDLPGVPGLNGTLITELNVF